ncbi:S1 family serine peptidase [Glacieibacterium frigidum]|nr:serine protease [Glacieibacterium frigidum]
MKRLLLAGFVMLTAAAPTPPPPPTPPPEESNGRIVGGVPALPGSARWQVELHRIAALKKLPVDRERPEWQRRHVCGGAWIAPGWVLTAAHCAEPETGLDLKADYIIRAGSLDISKSEGMRTYRIVRIMIHKGYRPGGPPPHDIALLRVEAIGPEIPVAEPPEPIALPSAATVLPANALVTVTGWGYQAVNDNKSVPGVLMAARLQLIPTASCAITGTSRALDPDQHLCAGPSDPEKPTDSCQGDSGGPLTWQGPRRRWYLVGLVSWGPKNVCGGGSPGIYTNVAAHLDWIERAKLGPEGRV